MTHTHFIGIGGTGLSAIAKVLLARGETVSGSDRSAGPLAQSVEAAGATVYIGHAPENINNADIVIRSSAVPDDNVEVVAARQADIPVLKRIDYLGQLLAGQRVVGVAGAHGKTTTTSMVVWLLSALKQDPGFIVGGQVANLDTNASAGGGTLFAIEADEYDYMFWGLTPEVAVVTNVEHDHVDCFPTEADFVAAFEGYADRLAPGGTLIICAEDAGAAALADYAEKQAKPVLRYGFTSSLDAHAGELQPQVDEGYKFTAYRNGKPWVDVTLSVPGKHNVLNALAALLVMELLNLDVSQAAAALAQFQGAGRRFDIRGEANGVLIVDDYGHHPTEIKTTLEGARARYPDRRIWAVWQPHTYSRTWGLREQFATAFRSADRVLVTPIYAAREEKPVGYEFGTVIGLIEEPMAAAMMTLDHTTQYLTKAAQPGDVVIVFSAGDAIRVSEGLYTTLMEQEVAG